MSTRVVLGHKKLSAKSRRVTLTPAAQKITAVVPGVAGKDISIVCENAGETVILDVEGIDADSPRFTIQFAQDLLASDNLYISSPDSATVSIFVYDN